MKGAPLLALEGVSQHFVRRLDAAGRLARLLGADVREEVVRAVDDVSLEIAEGEVLGLVGESGCGKSTLGRMVVGILGPTAGTIRWRGTPVAEMTAEQRRRWVLAVQMIFQDPMSSLNPRHRVRDIIGEAPRVHGTVPRVGIEAYVLDLMRRVGLDPGFARRFPHQFSGGQRQRIGIAWALAVQPELLVCDEAVAALDVSIQAQVLNLFMELREDFNLTYLFISHDLGVVHHLADRVAIMYLGRIVESAPAEALFARPNHPYTEALLAEIPDITQRRRSFAPIAGEIPSPIDPPPGCHFHPRCPHAFARCSREAPVLREIAPGRRSSTPPSPSQPMAAFSLAGCLPTARACPFLERF